ncbi:hypothetical protein Glove_712g25 [Diversispora epigaea]|uniref:ATP phosphoribosyltransferase n=1 Tax=Diversispora epigaea TaxID=1348612 RepID=A0A397G536_9GLOM|nr:hypothetical protein Glove_712g25 [Diversispora epigaea]
MTDIINKLSDRLLFAIPKKGYLHEQSLSLLKGADLNFHRRNRLDIALVQNFPIALVFLPATDIPKYVGEGNVDLGITGQDEVAESEANDKIDEILELGFGKCELQVQVPVVGGATRVEELVGKKIVTSFEILVRKYFDELDQKYLTEEQKQAGVKTKIEYVSGSVEAACALGLGDGIVDLVESGKTMKAAGLHPISTILSSQAILICSKNPSDLSLVSKITSRIKGVIAAQKYVLVNYNVQRVHLEEAIKITPGRRAPLISPLEDSEWAEVQSMADKCDIAKIMDKLEEIGAKDILILEINNCRV